MKVLCGLVCKAYLFCFNFAKDQPSLSRFEMKLAFDWKSWDEVAHSVHKAQIYSCFQRSGEISTRIFWGRVNPLQHALMVKKCTIKLQSRIFFFYRTKENVWRKRLLETRFTRLMRLLCGKKICLQYKNEQSCRQFCFYFKI